LQKAASRQPSGLIRTLKREPWRENRGKPFAGAGILGIADLCV
jgi:hypothetical protein